MSFIASQLTLSTKEGRDRACMPLTTLRDELRSDDPNIAGKAYISMLERVKTTTSMILRQEPVDGGKFMDEVLKEIVEAAKVFRDSTHPTGTLDWQVMNTQIISLTGEIACLPFSDTWSDFSVR